MNKDEIIKSIISILEKIENEKVLKEIKNIINAIYKHYVSGKWEC